MIIDLILGIIALCLMVWFWGYYVGGDDEMKRHKEDGTDKQLN